MYYHSLHTMSSRRRGRICISGPTNRNILVSISTDHHADKTNFRIRHKHPLECVPEVAERSPLSGC